MISGKAAVKRVIDASWPSSRFMLDRRRGPANSLRWPRWYQHAGGREFGSQSSHTGLARSSKAVSVNGVKSAGNATSRETQIDRAAVAPTTPTLADFLSGYLPGRTF